MNIRDVPVLIMAGGTGGHIFPGLALAAELEKQSVPVHWLGAAGGMEVQRVPSHGIEIDLIRISGVRGKGLLGWMALPFRLARAVLDAARCMRRIGPACAVSFGGYAAGPGGLAAWIRGIPLVVHEQNRIPGMTNRFLARFATHVFQAFPGTFPESMGALTCGNPVRASLGALPDPEIRFGGREGIGRLLVTGGSQGAASLNRLVPAALARLQPDQRPEVLHQAGRKGVESTSEAYKQAGVEAEVVEFIEDMATAYGAADLVVCRSGALTISELAVVGIGAILVPFPHAVDDHQTRNAEVLEKAGAAVIFQEQGLEAGALAAALSRVLSSRPEILAMARAARRVGVRDAALQLASVCLDFRARANSGKST